jgi:anti-sigma factor RsiW
MATMTADWNEVEQPEDANDDALVAYLDGELDPEASRAFERRLSEDPALRRRLQQHQQAWDLLENMPHTEVGDTFTRTTVEMVAVSAAEDVQKVKRAQGRRRRALWAACGGGLLGAASAGYLCVSLMLSAPDRQLVKDLPIIENLDAYRNAETVDFLRALQKENLFAAEVEDAP